MKLFLASRSPRRQQLLQQLAVEFATVDVDIDEHYSHSETARDYVQRMAREKAGQGRQRIAEAGIVIAADTSVVLDDTVLGKAETADDVMSMLGRLSGRRHQVMTAVVVSGRQTHSALSVSHVCFKALSQQEIRNYAKLSEPIGKAGGYAIQGQAAGFIQRIEGSYSGIMGLPLYETAELLNNFRP